LAVHKQWHHFKYLFNRLCANETDLLLKCSDTFTQAVIIALQPAHHKISMNNIHPECLGRITVLVKNCCLFLLLGIHVFLIITRVMRGTSVTAEVQSSHCISCTHTHTRMHTHTELTSVFCSHYLESIGKETVCYKIFIYFITDHN
jgi:hypothetical protein